MSNSTFFGLDVQVSTPVSVLIVICLTLLAGCMAGLLLCAFGIDINRLHAMINGQNPQEAKQARRVLLIVKNPHWLLITLIIWNDIALEMMPLIFHTFLNPFVAIIMSVTITLMFCEIIPEAIFIHHAFTMCALLAPFVYFLMLLSAPISWPIAKLLDRYIGDKVALCVKRRELNELIRYQEKLLTLKRKKAELAEESDKNVNTDPDEGGEEDLTKEEITIMLNVLSLSETNAKKLLQMPIQSTYRVHVDTIITEELVEHIFSNGYSFVGVYEDVDDLDNVTSVLMTKALLLLVYRSQQDNWRVKDLPLMVLERLKGSTSGTEVFVALQNLSPPIAAITDEDDNKVYGLLTLQHVTETIHQTSFKAEMDPDNKSPMQLIVRSWDIFRNRSERTVRIAARSRSHSAGRWRSRSANIAKTE